MREVLEMLSGSVHLFGYTIPVITLIIAAFFLFAVLFRNAWLAIIGFFILLITYFLPASF